MMWVLCLLGSLKEVRHQGTEFILMPEQIVSLTPFNSINEGKLDHILITGGLGFAQEGMSYAAIRLKSFLTMAGVPDSVITTETGAVNTYENALNSAKILNEHFPNQKYLLITSAFHMKRSSLCLKKQDIVFDEFPAGFKTDRSTLNFDDLFIPRAQAIGKWEDLFKEFAGILTYKLMGYL